MTGEATHRSVFLFYCIIKLIESKILPFHDYIEFLHPHCETWKNLEKLISFWYLTLAEWTRIGQNDSTQSGNVSWYAWFGRKVSNYRKCIKLLAGSRLWKLFFFFTVHWLDKKEFHSFAVSIWDIKRRATINCSNSCH